MVPVVVFTPTPPSEQRLTNIAQFFQEFKERMAASSPELDYSDIRTPVSELCHGPNRTIIGIMLIIMM